MTKYAIVPQEATQEIRNALIKGVWEGNGWKNAVAARPPLDADMQQALELAQWVLTRSDANPVEVQIARALLRANGEEA